MSKLLRAFFLLVLLLPLAALADAPVVVGAVVLGRRRTNAG